MNADQLTERMHAVLDGTASPEQIRALDAALAADAVAAQEFASWKGMFHTLAAMPMAHPPEGLVAAISAAVPSAAAPRRRPQSSENFSLPGQLSSAASVIVSGPAQTKRVPWGFRAMFQRPDRPDSTQGSQHMKVNRKIWAGSAIAAVALGVAIVVSGYPPKAENLTGTVVPAERYRAPQSGAEAIKLGEQGSAQATPGTDAGGVQAAKTDAQMQAEKTDAAFRAAKTDAQLQAEKADAAFRAAKTDAQLKAEKTDASFRAAKTDAQLQAEKADAAFRAAKSDAQLKAEKSDAAFRAAKTDAQLQAEKSSAQMQANKAATN